ncbi:MAG: DUF4392 domain-containing protein [Clostridia bacterium]|nr:DUF4392 domain-containing protein [Clostridia bacterium]
MSTACAAAQIIAENVDSLVTIDFHARGIVEPIYRAARARQGGQPLAYRAALALAGACAPSEGGIYARPTVIIGTGFMIRAAGAPETDGITGAALLARGLTMAHRAIPLIVSEEAAIDVLQAACSAAGLAPAIVRNGAGDEMQVASAVEAFRCGADVGVPPVVLVSFPLDRNKALAAAQSMASAIAPQAMISIERPGLNRRGVHHNSWGRSISDITACVDELFLELRRRGTLTVAIGDLGNELGMGCISDTVEWMTPFGRECSCPCGGGMACSIESDVTVVGSVSDDVAYGILACMAHLSGQPEVLPSPELGLAVLDAAVAAGAVDGLTGERSASIDMLDAYVHSSILQLLKAILDYADRHTSLRPEFLTHLASFQ